MNPDGGGGAGGSSGGAAGAAAGTAGTGGEGGATGAGGTIIGAPGAAGAGGGAGAVGAGGGGHGGATGAAGNAVGTGGNTGAAGAVGSGGHGGKTGTAGTGGGTGAAGTGGSAQGAAGAIGTGGLTGTAGAVGTGGRGGTNGTAGTGGSTLGTAGAIGSAGSTGAAGAVGTGGRGGTSGTAGTGGSACVPTTFQLLQDPNFDTTSSAWTEDSGYGAAIIGPPDPALGLTAQTSPNIAWEGGYDNAQDDLYQDVTIPASATSITFSFYYWIATMEDPTYDYDVMTAYVYDPVTQGFTPVMTFSNVDETTGWTKFSAQIPLAWAGRVAEFGFLTTTDSDINTNFFIDTTSVTVTACASAGGAN